MAYNKINWEAGEVAREGYVIVDGQQYQTVQPEYKGSTPINPDNLNHMDNQIEALSVDYITEVGSDETWKWRKWASGRVELTGFKSHTGMNINQSSAGTFYGGSGTVALPFGLASVDCIMTQETAPRSSGVYIYTSTISQDIVTTEFRAHASGTNLNCGVNYYIIGSI